LRVSGIQQKALNGKVLILNMSSALIFEAGEKERERIFKIEEDYSKLGIHEYIELIKVFVKKLIKTERLEAAPRRNRSVF
jgi:hypothetical protein